ncbi:SatD family protein [Rhodohalobacter barkolensis]|uniref:SatD family (SatD) n=1 Tax=Rhodohalobacter barkolensis TaxID=2053187 RepID=A0A2N0VLL8_9BACT|nr:SatD family protein [Rhodohalobacter barkolensis]PKD45097.1 hypothetical protein CWD77_06495 [Rhodohalobacter barkolensis]
MQNYIVVIGDIIESKDLEADDRKETQIKLEEQFKKMNRESGQLLSPYTITLGDEFQAVYRSSDHLFRDIWTIMAQIHPVQIRINISVGEITTEINREQSIGMDGPVFHVARDQIEEMKKEDILLTIATDNKQFDRLVNSSFRILSANLRAWNRNRLMILKKRYEEIDVKQIAGELELSEVAVYKNIRAGTLDAIQDLTDSITEIVNEMVNP